MKKPAMTTLRALRTEMTIGEIGNEEADRISQPTPCQMIGEAKKMDRMLNENVRGHNDNNHRERRDEQGFHIVRHGADPEAQG